MNLEYLKMRPAEPRDFTKLPEDKKWAYNDQGHGLAHLWKAFNYYGDLVGVSIVGEFNKVGVVIMEEYRGKGFLKYMYPTDITLYAEINKKNISSIKAHERIGFVKHSETLHGEWLFRRDAVINHNYEIN